MNIDKELKLYYLTVSNSINQNRRNKIILSEAIINDFKQIIQSDKLKSSVSSGSEFIIYGEDARHNGLILIKCDDNFFGRFSGFSAIRSLKRIRGNNKFILDTKLASYIDMRFKYNIKLSGIKIDEFNGINHGFSAFFFPFDLIYLDKLDLKKEVKNHHDAIYRQIYSSIKLTERK